MKKLLIINAGGTSTKLGIFHNTEVVSTETYRHDFSSLPIPFSLWDQYDIRKKAVQEYLTSIISTSKASTRLFHGAPRLNHCILAYIKSISRC
ncbi:Butyrate kinase 2 [Budvicia aquatica]|uniref:Butyrate kinase 2 n=1 Tax=Budvicia aquatica TaxID=82979 RepID=A0A484ZU12_9GAMM|nr:Butyrate kinase 2 [Budvicia aquatica]